MTPGKKKKKTPCWLANDAVYPWEDLEICFWKYNLCFSCPSALFVMQQDIFLCDRIVQRVHET